MSVVITLPDEISDETAARIRDVLHELGDAFYELGVVVETRYGSQIRRYYCSPASNVDPHSHAISIH